MKIYLQLLAVDTFETTTSVIVNIESRGGLKKRFIFNCGEGTQRFCVQNSIRLSRFNALFFTQLSWDQLGGVPGAILTMADSNVGSLDLVGPAGLLGFLEATRYFVFRPEMKFRVQEISGIFVIVKKDDLFVWLMPFSLSQDEDHDSSVYKDDKIEGLEIHAIILTGDQAIPKKKVANENNEAVSYKGEKNESEIQVSFIQKEEGSKMYNLKLGREDFLVKKNLNDETLEPENSYHPIYDSVENDKFSPPLLRLSEEVVPLPHVLCYAFHSPEIRGQFDKNKAKELGVVGRHFRDLADGNTIMTHKGITVSPSDVISPTIPGPIAIIVHCPSLHYLKSLVNHTAFVKYYTPTNSSNTTYHSSSLQTIVHIAPQEVISCGLYSIWVSLFPNTVKHIFSNIDICGSAPAFTGWADNHVKLSALEPNFFPPPYAKYTKEPLPRSLACDDIGDLTAGFFPSHVGKPDTSGRFVRASPLLIYNLSPIRNSGFDYKRVVRPWIWGDELQKYVATSSIISSLRENTAMVITDSSPSLVFLGTGAALPSKYRNVTSNFISVPSFGNMLLDSGEGSLGQLYRRFGAELPQVIKKLKMIFISHMHADHHLGLVRILTYRHQVALENMINEPVLIVGPTYIRYWLSEYSNYDNSSIKYRDGNLSHSYTFIDCKEVKNHRLGLTNVETVLVDHCFEAYGIAITHKDGWKCVFSGDTRPCENLVKAGENATIVIHEATFNEQMQEDAISKRHSTTSEALESAKLMKAKALIMNHFSQRYPKLSALQNNHDYKENTMVVDANNGSYSSCDSPCDKLLVSSASDLMSVSFSSLEKLNSIQKYCYMVLQEELEGEGSSSSSNTGNIPKEKKVVSKRKRSED